jgi:hypothetical protein
VLYQNSYVDTLIPDAVVFGDEAFERQLELHEVIMGLALHL